MPELVGAPRACHGLGIAPWLHSLAYAVHSRTSALRPLLTSGDAIGFWVEHGRPKTLACRARKKKNQKEPEMGMARRRW